jgi:uncharacterized protein (TIGR02246 family)
MTYTARDTPESIPIVFVEAWNNRDPDTLASLFDEDAEFVNVVGLWWHTRDAIRRAHAYGLTTIFNQSTARLGVVRVKRLSDDIAVVHARMSLTGQTPIGDVQSPRPRSNVFSFVVHRSAEGWSCASAHNTDVVPNAETNIIDAQGNFRSIDYRHSERSEGPPTGKAEL